MAARLGCWQRDRAQRGYSHDQIGPIHHARYFPLRRFNNSISVCSCRRQSTPEKHRYHHPQPQSDANITEALGSFLKGSERAIQVQFTTLENALWALSQAGNIALLAILLTKKRARSFPVFTTFIAYLAIETLVLFRVAQVGNKHAYFLAYWLFAGGDYLLQIAVIFEMARDVLRPTGTWIRDARKSFLLWSCVGTIVAAAFAFAIAPPGRKGLELWSVRSSLFTSFLTCELFLAMATAANRLGLQWRNHVMALGQGLTFWAGVALMADIANYVTGWKSGIRAFDYMRIGAYDTAVLFWTISFALPERLRAPLSNEMQQYLAELHASVQHDLDTIRPENKPRP